MSSFLSHLKSLLVPQNDIAEVKTTSSEMSNDMSRQDLLDAIERQYQASVASETTRVSLLFHTSYVVYLRQKDYERLADGFQFTVRDAVAVFISDIKSRMSVYRNYVPHSNFWTFQLVCIPEGALIEDVSDEDADSKVIVIRSSLFAPDEYVSAGCDGGGRVVTTVHDVNSMKAMPRAININAIAGLVRLDKDKFRVKFDPDNLLGFGENASMTEHDNNVVARLTADDGRFVKDGRTFSTFQMRSNQLRISGRNDMERRGYETVCVDNDEILNPHVVVTQDAATGRFSLVAYGPLLLNERRIEPGQASVELPDKSVMLLNGEVQISFKIMK